MHLCHVVGGENGKHWEWIRVGERLRTRRVGVGETLDTCYRRPLDFHFGSIAMRHLENIERARPADHDGLAFLPRR